jgi:hypothetical protein
MNMGISTRDDFLDLLAEIAQHLPGRWELVPFPLDYNWGGRLVNHEGQFEGEIIVFSAGYVPLGKSCEKMEIWGELPKNEKGESPYIGYGKKIPSINVSTSKTGTQIAKDIERRFLPAYAELFEEAVKTVRSQDAYYSKRDAMALQIAQIVKVDEDRISDGKVDFYRSPYHVFNETLAEADVSDDDVKLTLRLSYRDTLDVLKYLTSRDRG